MLDFQMFSPGIFRAEGLIPRVAAAKDTKVWPKMTETMYPMMLAASTNSTLHADIPPPGCSGFETPDARLHSHGTKRTVEDIELHDLAVAQRISSGWIE